MENSHDKGFDAENNVNDCSSHYRPREMNASTDMLMKENRLLVTKKIELE